MERIKPRGKSFFYKLANIKLLLLFCIILIAFAIPLAVVFTHQMGKHFYSLPNGTLTVTSSPSVNSIGCGTVRILGIPVEADPPQAETCFLTAFKQCKPSKLTFVNNLGLESITTHEFSVVHFRGNCSIIDTFTSSTENVAPSNGGTYTNSSTCNGLIQQSKGLLFLNCGTEGNISIPPPSV